MTCCLESNLCNDEWQRDVESLSTREGSFKRIFSFLIWRRFHLCQTFKKGFFFFFAFLKVISTQDFNEGVDGTTTAVCTHKTLIHHVQPSIHAGRHVFWSINTDGMKYSSTYHLFPVTSSLHLPRFVPQINNKPPVHFKHAHSVCTEGLCSVWHVDVITEWENRRIRTAYNRKCFMFDQRS